ncbi:unnamed protein product [Arabis nemorensis]|uniref:Uncharacterized protein n=1 Tax=Arabis nemorensis TaxID=586526 RepID=A0A565CD95_9BRAS|nr:unnamed protein product [Arabis nemorensis]
MFVPLTSEIKKTAGAFAEGGWVGAAYYLLWYMLASHITGAFWYMFSVERKDTCLRSACKVEIFFSRFLSGICRLAFNHLRFI